MVGAVACRGGGAGGGGPWPTGASLGGGARLACICKKKIRPRQISKVYVCNETNVKSCSKAENVSAVKSIHIKIMNKATNLSRKKLIKPTFSKKVPIPYHLAIPLQKWIPKHDMTYTSRLLVIEVLPFIL